VRVILFHHEASAPDADSAAIGGKARGLAAAERAGFAVPPWFVLTSDAFTDSLGPTRRAALEQAVNTDSPARIVESVELSAAVRAELEAALATLCAGGERVAVRSSASDEDGAQHSFAGQLESVLDVAPADVAQRVREVWRSGFSARMLAYRREHGLAPLPRPPAVIVQRMVRARAAGVAFSADPISGRRAIAVVAAVRGVGASLVSGEADADTWRIDRRGTIIERVVGSAAAPVLRDEEVLAVARLVRAAARRFGRPQDIEWAFDADGVLLLLQARPITALATLADPDGVLTIWDNSNIVESYSGVTTPLTFSFASEIYAHVYRQFCRLMRVPARVIEAHDDVFRNMLGLVRGRLYYNLPNWYRVLALLPGYRVNRPFMEQMMGVREPLPAEVTAQIERELADSSRGRLSDAFHLAATLVGLLVNYATLGRRVRAFTRLLDDALAPPDPPLEDRRPDELVAHYRELRQRLLLKWDAPLVNDFFAMIFYGLLRRLVQTWCGDPHGTLQNDLVGGTGGMVSAEPAIRLHHLANLAAANPTLRDQLVTGTLPAIEQAMTTAPTFRTEYTAYLDKFGERTVNELKLESTTLHDDPLPLLRAIGNLAQQQNPAGGSSGSSDNVRSAVAEGVGGEGRSPRPRPPSPHGQDPATPAGAARRVGEREDAARPDGAIGDLAQQQNPAGASSGSSDNVRSAVAEGRERSVRSLPQPPHGQVPAGPSAIGGRENATNPDGVGRRAGEPGDTAGPDGAARGAGGRGDATGPARSVGAGTHGEGLRVEGRGRVRGALRGRPVRALVFGWVLRQAQGRVRDRENLRLERTRLFGRIRRIMREMGRRLEEVGLLAEAGDVFYLEVEEVLALVEGRATCADVGGLARVRRAEFVSYAATAAPDDRFETRGLVYQGHAFRQVAGRGVGGVGGGGEGVGVGGVDGGGQAGRDERRGLGCCPGVVRGAVRVVADPRGVTLEPGTLLVAEHTDPGWILIFPSAAGLLVERGSLLSHAAIVARELGIPAVVSLPGLTRWLRDGDWVEIDGSTGLVRRVVGPEPAPERTAEADTDIDTGAAHAG
jgi:phosphohistidine swiveling domain-containing protein